MSQKVLIHRSIVKHCQADANVNDISLCRYS